MATRLYFPSTGTPDVLPTINNGGEWEHSNGVRRPLVTRLGSSALSTDAYAPDAADHLTNGDALIYQYVLTDKLSAHTISGQTVKWQFQCLEAHTNNNLFLTLKIFVCGNDGTIKETLLAIRRDATEVATSLTNRGDSANISSATVEADDRIVVEIGLGGTPASASGVQGHNGSIRFGESASSGDLPEDDSTTTTTYRPWLEFANTLALNQTVTQSSTFTNSASFYAGTVSPGSVTVTQSSSYTNSFLFFAGTVTAAYTITQSSSYVNESGFLSGNVTAGEVAVTQGGAFSNEGVFYAGSVAAGKVTVTQSNSHLNATVFYAGDVSAAVGSITITQDSAFSNAEAFYPGAVAAGAASITQDGIYLNSAMYYGGGVTTGAAAVDQGVSFINNSAFYAGDVSVGDVLVAQDSGYANTQTFYPGVFFGSGESVDQVSAYENAATFYSVEVNSNYSLLFNNVYINESLIYSGNVITGGAQVDQTTVYENASSFFDAAVARQIQAAIEVVVSLNETVINCIYDVIDINVSEAANNILCSHIDHSIIVDYSGDFNIVVNA